MSAHNTYRTRGDVVHIDLRDSADEVVAVTKIDREDWHRRVNGVWLQDRKWVLRGKGYVGCWGKGGVLPHLYLHRVVAGTQGTKMWTDHKNGDRLDNRKSNLRAVDASQSQINKRTKRGELRNVYQDPRTGHWNVRLVKEFKTLEEAKTWRDKTTELVFGLDFLAECFNR